MLVPASRHEAICAPPEHGITDLAERATPLFAEEPRRWITQGQDDPDFLVLREFLDDLLLDLSQRTRRGVSWRTDPTSLGSLRETAGGDGMVCCTR